MLLSNYTFNVELSHALLFERMLEEKIIPFLNGNNLVNDAKSFKLLTETHNDGLTVSVQLFFQKNEDFDAFEQKHHLELVSIVEKSFAGKFVYFQSLLQAY